MKKVTKFKSLLGIILCLTINISVITCFTVNANANDILPASTKIFNNHTYEYYNVGTDWKNAYKICERKGGHLVTITSQEENDFVYELIKDFSNLYCWLGASDYNSQQKWYWVNGEAFLYENWDKDDNEPNNGNGNGTEDFLQMYRKNGKWNDAKYSNTTSDSKSGFICEYDEEINAELYQPQMEFFYQNSRYEVFEGKKIDWQTAKKVCEAKGGHLAIIDCEDENVEITNAINSCSLTSFWIGYTDSGTEGIWRNVNGETPKYTNWDTETKEPNNDLGVEDYAALEKSRNGKWNDFGAFVFSSKTVGFICEYENQATNISPIKTIKSDGHTYELYDCHETWREAYKFCERKGGHLVTISNKIENDLVLNFAKQSANIRLWLGATDFNREQNWYWVNGDSFKYDNWESSQPDNSGGVEHFAAMYLDGEKAGLWNDVSFDNATICGKGSFICEYEDTIDAEYYEPSKTIERNNKRYEIYDYSVSAQNAKIICEKKGGCLVTIQDEEENDFIHNIIQDSVKDEFWIGYNDLKTEGNWEWFSGQEATFENWGDGYKSNSEGMEDYAIIWKSNGQWNDLKGFSFAYHSTGFICEYVKYEEISQTTYSEPTTVSSISDTYTTEATEPTSDQLTTVIQEESTTIVFPITEPYTHVSEVSEPSEKNDVFKDTIVIKSQKISAKSFKKTYGNKPFNLKAKTSGNGKLSYKSSNKKVVTVSSKGKVTIKGCGKATITIKAAETSTYKSAAKNITLTVKPKKLKIKSGSGNKKAYTIKFKSQKTVSGYECTYKNGGKNHKITVNSKKSSVTLKKLVKGNCVVKIRAYKKVGKTKLYGAYGKIRLSIS